jgi:hypothetical protein
MTAADHANTKRMLRDIRRMERLVAELPSYWDVLPAEAADEVYARVSRLRPRIEAFLAALARLDGTE